MRASGGLLRATAGVGSATLLSRLLGFVRDTVVANAFGAGPAADAFFVAFRIPNFLRRLLAEGAFTQAFVPVLGEYQARGDVQATRRLIAHVYGHLGVIVTLISLTAVLGAPWLVHLFAPGFAGSGERHALATEMLRITFPYLACMSMAAATAGVLNAHGRFLVSALNPVLLNLAMIAAAWWLAPHMDPPVVALAWGVLLGGVAQVLWQLPFVASLGLLPMPRLRRGEPGVSKILRLMIPGAFGASAAQVNLLIDTVIASFLAAGSVSWLYYADRLIEFPLGIFGIAFATVTLPRLSNHHARGESAAFSATLDWSLRWVLVLGVPASAGIALLAGPMLTTLFNYGAFSGADVAMARLSLWAYAPGLLAFMLIKVLAPGFFARQDTRTPVRIGVIALVANTVLSLSLMGLLHHAGLALATSLAAYLNALLLLRALRRSGGYHPGAGWPAFVSRVGIATTVMCVALLGVMPTTESWQAWPALIRVMALGGMIAVGAAVYGATALAVRLPLASLWRPNEA